MKKFIQKKLKEQKGMTLIELLAVIVIIAIIAAIAIPAIGNIIENSRVGAAKSDALNAFAAADLYLVDNPDDSTISLEQLTDGGYLDDLGSFGEGSGSGPSFTLSADDSTTAAVDESGDLLITGTAENGSVTVTFTAASRDEVQELANSDRPTGTPIAVSTD